MEDEKKDTTIGAIDQGATNTSAPTKPDPRFGMTLPPQPLQAAVVSSVEAPVKMPQQPVAVSDSAPAQVSNVPEAVIHESVVTPPIVANMPKQGGMAGILAGIKLPERREFRAAADVTLPPVQAPTEYPLDKEKAPPLADAVTHTPGTQQSEAPDIMAPVRTYPADLKGVVRDQKVTLIHAAALETEKKYAREKAVPAPGAQQRSRRTVGIVFAILLFLFLGAAALFGIAYVSQQHSTQVQVPTDTSLIFAEQHATLPLESTSPADLKQTIARMRMTTNAPLGAITRIMPTFPQTNPDGTPGQRLATTQELLKALGVTLSDDTLRAFSDTFFFGIHTVDKNALVLVIPVVSYDRAFAGMLAWEPQMNRDLSPSFTSVTATVSKPDGTLAPREFQDTVMRNYDVRTLKDDNGTIQLYYSFPSPSVLIIAESPYSFAELLSRLQSGRRL